MPQSLTSVEGYPGIMLLIVSLPVGQKKSQEELTAAFKSDHALTESFGRMTEHLGQNNVETTSPPAWP